MDLSGQKDKTELVKNVKMGFGRPNWLGIFMHFRAIRVKLSFTEVHKKRFFHQNGAQGCNR